jgi:hypothetical protein
MNSSIFSAGIYSSVFPGFNSLFWIELDMNNTKREQSPGFKQNVDFKEPDWFSIELDNDTCL